MSSVKKCTRCKKELEITLFNKWKNGEYLSNCIDCNIKRQLVKKKTHKKCCNCKEIKLIDDFKKSDKGKSKFCINCLEKQKDVNKKKRVQRYNKNKEKCIIETNAKSCSRCYNKKDFKQFKKRKNGEYYSGCIECNIKKTTSSNNYRYNKTKEEDIINISENKKCNTCYNNKPLSEFKKNKKNYTKICIECLSKYQLQNIKRKEYDESDINNKKCVRCFLIKPIEMFKKTKKRIQKQCEDCCIHYKNLQKERRQRLMTIIELKQYEKQCTRCFEIKYQENFKSNKHKHCNTCNTSHKEYLIKSRCEHGCLNKSACYKCLGGSICIHKKKKSECKECNFKGYLYSKVYKRVKMALKKSKNKKSIEYLGCNIETFKKHLEQKFVEGMSWENYGKIWHIDHIIPISYKNPSLDEVIQRLHYLNTQPLWASENISKGNRYIG